MTTTTAPEITLEARFAELDRTVDCVTVKPYSPSRTG